jgi:hypothetical protein
VDFHSPSKLFSVVLIVLIVFVILMVLIHDRLVLCFFVNKMT